ncbi:MAG: beta-ketoacyl synthase N-terminal-like domain-containing protein, partial [Armatimonadota bacterium]|nr:beta-ketoacyl synthase N-terminal-like domain-containing protein [Armatimonadota bacterium]
MSVGDGEERRRVVVTGVGVVCCLGLTTREFWEGLCAGRTGIAPVERLDMSGLRNVLGGEVKHPELLNCPTGAASGDLAACFALAASREAVTDAGILGCVAPERAGIAFSTNFGGAAAWERFATRFSADPVAARPEDLWHYTFEAAATQAAGHFGFAGPRTTLSLSCSSGAAAIAWGMDAIRCGRADVVLAGGHDALSLSALAGLSALRTITAEMIRPFDR